MQILALSRHIDTSSRVAFTSRLNGKLAVQIQTNRQLWCVKQTTLLSTVGLFVLYHLDYSSAVGLVMCKMSISDSLGKVRQHHYNTQYLREPSNCTTDILSATVFGIYWCSIIFDDESRDVP